MFRNYLAAALRNLVRNRLYAAINIAGLSVGFAAAILIALFVRDEFSYDKWIPGHEEVYRVSEILSPSGHAPITNEVTFPRVGEWLKSDFASVQAAARLESTHVSLRHSDVESIEQNAAWADSDIFSVLPLKAIAGDLGTALKRPDAIVLTRAVARKHFGRDDVVGQTVEINRQHPMVVTAVLEDLPSATHLNVSIFISGLAPFSGLAALDAMSFGPNQVPAQSTYTYFRLKPGAAIEDVRKGVPALIGKYLPHEIAGQKTSSFYNLDFVPLDAIHLRPAATSMKPAGDRNMLLAISTVGVLILLVAGINFVNLMTARALRRAVEVGVRKVAGADRRDLIIQFVGESLIYVVLAVVAAVALAKLFLPTLNGFLDRDIAFDLGHPSFVGETLALAAMMGILAGFYPSFVMSAFRPSMVLKGRAVRATGSSMLRELLVLVQFAVLIGLIFSTTIIYRQTLYALHERLRFDTDQVVIISTSCNLAFKNEVQALPGVRTAACSSGSAMNFARTGTTAHLLGGADGNFRTSSIDFGFFNLYGLQPLAGRSFAEDRGTDATPSTGNSATNPPIVINETAVRRLGFSTNEAAIGQNAYWLRLLDMTGKISSSNPSEIIGVVPDFSTGSVREEIEPTFYYVDSGIYQYLSVKLRGDQIPDTLRAIDGLWASNGNSGVIRRFFLNRILESLYVDVVRQQIVFAVFSGIAIFIACLGLFGLSAFTAERRTKEIGIRKAMGASSVDVVRLLLWQFTKPVLWANLIAWPVAGYFMHRWLAGFAYHIDLDPLIFVGASAVAVIIALGTVSTHAILVARAKPVTALRYE